MYRTIAFISLVVCSAGFSILETDRIVNGTDATSEEIPFIVSWRFRSKHFCGGSILDPIHILTAAHCVIRRHPTNINIQYGVNTIEEDLDHTISVEAIYIHKNYQPIRYNRNDVAVIRLKQPLPFSKVVQSVILPKQNESIPGNSLAILAGWGRTYTNGPLPKKLQKVVITVYTPSDCKKVNLVTNSTYHICAGIPEGGRGQCTGDSGGPLVAEGKQVGIVSWSFKPCTKAGPGVFTRVSQYVEWIHSQMAL